MRFTGATVQENADFCAQVFSSGKRWAKDRFNGYPLNHNLGWNPSVSKQIRYMSMYKHHDYLASMNIDTVYHSTTSIMNIYGM